MSKYLGDSMLLKVESAPASGTYAKIGGASSHSVSINNEAVDVSDKDSNRFKELLAAGDRSIAISMEGFISDEANFEIFRVAARDDAIINYTMEFGNAKTIVGAFHIDSFEMTGARNEGQGFSSSLSNSGEPTTLD
tara:strand:- start:6353 stop:6760 length:408 start_codon:yes stop_codon:yes gene_type:complete